MNLMCPQIDFALDEWATGILIKATLWQKEVEDRHLIFRQDLEKWSKLKDNVVLGIRTKLYKRARYMFLTFKLPSWLTLL